MAWRYTVNIPLWIMGKDAEGETVAVSAHEWRVVRGAPRAPGGAFRCRCRLEWQFDMCAAIARPQFPLQQNGAQRHQGPGAPACQQCTGSAGRCPSSNRPPHPPQSPHPLLPTPPPPPHQLYRVNVLLQPPDATDQAALSRPPYFVLRRYSQFRQLFLDVSRGGRKRRAWRRNQICCAAAAAAVFVMSRR